MVHFAVIDVGTSSIRCFVYNESFEIISSSSRELEVLLPQIGHVEIDPEKLFSDVLAVIEEAVTKSVQFSNVVLGISTQRSTFTTWSKSTGKIFHNFITWNDIRGDKIVKEWNKSLSMRALNLGANLIYSVTRSSRYLAGSILKLMNTQVTPRLLWVMQNNTKLSEAIKNHDALFGTVDSYLLYRLRQGKEFKEVEHISEVTNCTATGIFDPFTLRWAGWAMKMFKFKIEMFPKVVDDSYEFGEVDKSYFGVPIKIVGVMGDQAASVLGNCCVFKGDAKVTLGSGTFFNINTSKKCHASILGLYPLVSSQIREHGVSYCMEGSSSNTATIIKWGKSIGLYDDPSESEGLAESVSVESSIYFIPAFNGLSAPINDFRAATGFIGIQQETTKSHLVRALLESIVFRVAQLLNASVSETEYEIKKLRIDGGVSRNNFICQTLADLCQLDVERSNDTENTSLGIAFVCAYNLRLVSIEDIRKSYKSGRIFTPRKEFHQRLQLKMRKWEEAVERFKEWYDYD